MKKDDIIVLFGGWVHFHFPADKVQSHIIKLPHPSAIRSGTENEKYKYRGC